MGLVWFFFHHPIPTTQCCVRVSEVEIEFNFFGFDATRCCDESHFGLCCCCAKLATDRDVNNGIHVWHRVEGIHVNKTCSMHSHEECRVLFRRTTEGFLRIRNTSLWKFIINCVCMLCMRDVDVM